MYSNLLERFLDYIKIDTRSNEESNTIPSTDVQIFFAKKLADELIKIGMEDVKYNKKNGYVIATLNSNTDKKIDSIGFIAHIDTADFNSENITPNFVKNYDGISDIVLNEEKQIVLKVKEFPNILKYKGQTIITTDGTTLLGADDKAGIAEIITVMEVLINNPKIKHGRIMIAFGPDEEIGRGMDHFDINDFDVDYAYTIDGSVVGELQYETFNAARVEIHIKGNCVHTGTAKNRLINAFKLAIGFDNMLPQEKVPEKTEGYEGFFYLQKIEGTVDAVKMIYLIRDHDMEKLEEYKRLFIKIQDDINSKYDEKRVSINIKDQYKNMKEIILNNMKPINIAKEAMENVGIKPIIEPIRGGTDGAKLSFLGIPTPNIFAGGENFHGPYEFIAVESMQKAVDVIREIVTLNERKG